MPNKSISILREPSYIALPYTNVASNDKDRSQLIYCLSTIMTTAHLKIMTHRDISILKDCYVQLKRFYRDTNSPQGKLLNIAEKIFNAQNNQLRYEDVYQALTNLVSADYYHIVTSGFIDAIEKLSTLIQSACRNDVLPNSPFKTILLQQDNLNQFALVLSGITHHLTVILDEQETAQANMVIDIRQMMAAAKVVSQLEKIPLPNTNGFFHPGKKPTVPTLSRQQRLLAKNHFLNGHHVQANDVKKDKKRPHYMAPSPSPSKKFAQ